MGPQGLAVLRFGFRVIGFRGFGFWVFFLVLGLWCLGFLFWGSRVECFGIMVFGMSVSGLGFFSSRLCFFRFLGLRDIIIRISL